MSFINDIAFDERLAVLEIEGTLTVGGGIYSYRASSLKWIKISRSQLFDCFKG